MTRKQRSHSTPAPKKGVVITPLEARAFGEQLADAERAQQLAASALSSTFDFYARDALLGSGSFGSVRACRSGEAVAPALAHQR
jgi:hypothetical protein